MRPLNPANHASKPLDPASRRKLKEILAELYPSEADARRILTDAGVRAAAIDLGGAARNRTSAIIEECERQGALEQLVKRARDEYPERLYSFDRLVVTARLGASLPEVPAEIVRAAREERLLVVLGPRLALVEPERLVQIMLGELDPPPSTPFAEEDSLTAQNTLKRRWTEDERRARILTILTEADRRSYPSAPTLAALSEIPDTAFVTVNSDSMFESVATPPLRVLLASEAAANQGGRCLFKTRGDVRHPASVPDLPLGRLIVGLRSPAAWGSLVRRWIETRLWLFVGFNDREATQALGELEELETGPKLRVWFVPFDPSQKERLPGDNVIPLADTSHTAAWLGRLADRIALDRMSARLVRVESLNEAYSEEAGTELKQRREAARKLDDLHEVRAAFASLLRDIEARYARDPSPAWRRRRAQAHIDLAIAHANLHEPETALRLLGELGEEDGALLRPKARAKAAEMFALLGDHARARVWLPADEGADDQERAQVLESRWRVALARGEVPGGEVPASPWVRLDLAWHRLREGRLDAAFELALGPCEEGTGTLAFTAASLLAEVFHQTVWDDRDTTSPLPEDPSLRERGVRAVDRTFKQLLSVELPTTGEYQKQLLWNYRLWAGLALHPSQHADADVRLRTVMPEEAPSLDGDATAPAWRRAYTTIVSHAQEGRIEEALRLSTEAVQEYPGREPLLSMHAQVLLHNGHGEDALPFAERAFALFPSKRERSVLVQALLAAKRGADAWEKSRDDFADEPVPSWAAFRASAAALAAPREAPEAWARVQTLEPASVEAGWNRAVALFDLGRVAEAAEVAWTLLDLPGRRQLRLDELNRIAQLTREGAKAAARPRLERIAREIADTLPDDPDAEAARFGLLAELGFPAEHREVRYALLSSSQWVETIEGTPEALVARLRAHHELREGARWLYRNGHLPFEALCSLLGEPAPRLVIEMLDLQEQAFFNAPLRTTPHADVRRLGGRRVLVSELELDLLEHFGLLRALVERLAPDGGLVLFEDVRAGVAASLAQTNARRQENELAQWSAFLDALLRVGVTLDGGSDPSSDEQRAHTSGHAWITARRPPTEAGLTVLHPRALALHLRHEITSQEWERLDARLPRYETDASFASLPAGAVCDADVVKAFHDAGVLRVLREAFPQGVAIGPEGARWIREGRRAAERAVKAGRLAERVYTTIGALFAEGKLVRQEARPEGDLPEARDGDQRESVEVLTRIPLAKALGWRVALEQNPDWLLLTMDGVVASPLSSASQLGALRWPSREAITQWFDRVHATDERVLHLGDLLPVLCAEEEEFRVRCDLASMGALEALTPAALVALVKRHQGLDGTRVRRILDAAERVVRTIPSPSRDRLREAQEHVEVPRARYHLAELYVQVIDRMVADDSSSDDLRRRVVFQLLDRLELHDPEAGGSMVARFAELLALQAVHRLEWWFEVNDAGTHASLSQERPIAVLWRAVMDWKEVRPERGRAVERGVRGALLFIDRRYAEGPPGPLTGVLAQLVGGPPAEGQVVSFCEPAFGALALLSATWRENPLERAGYHPEVSFESMLSAMASRLQSGDRDLVRTTSAVFAAFSLPGGISLRVAAPPEALLLRMQPVACAQHALGLATALGALDGRFAKELRRFAESPEDPERRRALAREAASATFRTVVDCPEVLEAWGGPDTGTLDPSQPHDLDDLRQILSEPTGGLSEGLLVRQIQAHVLEGGAWRAVPERRDLAEVAWAVPGDPAALLAGLRRGAAVLSHSVSAALKRLERPEEQPIGMLCVDLLTLTWTARKERHVTLSGGVIDLRERLSEVWLRAIRSALQDSERVASSAARGPSASVPRAFGELEASALRVCRAIIGRLGGPMVNPRDGVWMTWRLYAWLAWLAGHMEDSNRSLWLEAVARLDRSVTTPSAAFDRLDPATFAVWPHRLGVLLHALLTGDEIVAELARVENASPVPAVFSTELEELLASLASRALSPQEVLARASEEDRSVLGWRAPFSIPELALRALLAIDQRGLLRIAPERRLRWILDLPREGSELPKMPLRDAEVLVRALLACVDELSHEEALALAEYLGRLPDDNAHDLAMRVVGNALLVRAGHPELEKLLRDDLRQHVSEEWAADAFGMLLLSATREQPSRLNAEVEEMVEAARAVHGDPVPFMLAPTRLVLEGEPAQVEIATSWLRGLRVNHPDDARVARALAALGIGVDSAP